MSYIQVFGLSSEHPSSLPLWIHTQVFLQNQYLEEFTVWTVPAKVLSKGCLIHLPPRVCQRTVSPNSSHGVCTYVQLPMQLTSESPLPKVSNGHNPFLAVAKENHWRKEFPTVDAGIGCTVPSPAGLSPCRPGIPAQPTLFPAFLISFPLSLPVLLPFKTQVLAVFQGWLQDPPSSCGLLAIEQPHVPLLCPFAFLFFKSSAISKWC